MRYVVELRQWIALAVAAIATGMHVPSYKGMSIRRRKRAGKSD
jgi:hypothetical protein